MRTKQWIKFTQILNLISIVAVLVSAVALIPAFQGKNEPTLGWVFVEICLLIILVAQSISLVNQWRIKRRVYGRHNHSSPSKDTRDEE